MSEQIITLSISNHTIIPAFHTPSEVEQATKSNESPLNYARAKAIVAFDDSTGLPKTLEVARGSIDGVCFREILAILANHYFGWQPAGAEMYMPDNVAKEFFESHQIKVEFKEDLGKVTDIVKALNRRRK